MKRFLIYKTSYKNIAYFILYIILIELVLGGGGRFIEFGGITSRMFLFSFALTFAFIHISITRKINKEHTFLVILFSLILFFHLILGLFYNANNQNIIEDIKPLLYFYMLLYFSLFIKSIEQIKVVKKIIFYGSLILSISYILVLLSLYYGYIDLKSFYDQQYEIGEIYFRGDNLFFYKGFLYMCIGYIFVLTSDRKYKIPLLILYFTCIFLTLTRGFIIFTSIISLFYVYFINKNTPFKIIFTFVIIGLTSMFIGEIVEMFHDRVESDVVRYTQMYQVSESITPISLLFGHGFGIGVQDRPVHMENSFLEIFHKQGLIGILFWLLLFIYSYVLYFKMKANRNIALPFLLSITFIYLQSLTNPFVNNPIGLSMVLLSIVVLTRLKILEKLII